MKKLNSITAVLLLVLLQACGSERTQVVTVKSEPTDFKITKAQPATFAFKIEEGGSFFFGLDVVYFSQQMQGFTELNFNGEISGGGSHWRKEIKIPIHNEKGWMGEAQGEEHMDFLVKGEFADAAELKPGDYTFTLSPAESETREIIGMVSVNLNVLK